MSQSKPGAGFTFLENLVDFIGEVLKAVAVFSFFGGLIYIITRMHS
jgi:hypothetical protein